MTDPQLIFDQKIDLPFTYTIGAAQRAFLRGLTEGKLLASTGGGERYVLRALPMPRSVVRVYAAPFG